MREHLREKCEGCIADVKSSSHAKEQGMLKAWYGPAYDGWISVLLKLLQTFIQKLNLLPFYQQAKTPFIEFPTYKYI